MLDSPLFFCLLSAFCFGTWPILARFGNVSQAWFPVAVVFGTLLGTLAGLPFIKDRASPLTRDGMIVAGAGLLNGIGFLFFTKVINWKGQDLSRLLPIVFALMPVFTLAAAMLLLHEPLTAKKAAGLALAAGAVWLLN